MSGYRQLTAAALPAFLAGLPALAERLGGASEAWRVREVSDGNLNLVFLVEGPSGALCVKQALPHVRVDPSWPMPPDRAAFETAWMRLAGPLAAGRLPALYHFDATRYVIVMEALLPHVVLRQALIAGRRFSRAATHVADYVADVAFHTSDLARPFAARLADAAIFARNTDLLGITVDLVLTDPYVTAPRNRWTRPYLDAAARAIREDLALKREVARLGYEFLNRPQALLHGDLHTGSVMVTETDTRVIDGEFALFGPIGFDLGAFVANLLLAYFAQPGHATSPGARADYQVWLLSEIEVFWQVFRDRFLAHWREQGRGDAYPASFFPGPGGEAALEEERGGFVQSLWRDCLGFAGMKMIRRLLGFAHVADFESIADARERARLEVRALAFARRLILHRFEIGDPAALAALARDDRPNPSFDAEAAG